MSRLAWNALCAAVWIAFALLVVAIWPLPAARSESKVGKPHPPPIYRPVPHAPPVEMPRLDPVTGLAWKPPPTAGWGPAYVSFMPMVEVPVPACRPPDEIVAEALAAMTWPVVQRSGSTVAELVLIGLCGAAAGAMAVLGTIGRLAPRSGRA